MVKPSDLTPSSKTLRLLLRVPGSGQEQPQPLGGRPTTSTRSQNSVFHHMDASNGKFTDDMASLDLLQKQVMPVNFVRRTILWFVERTFFSRGRHYLAIHLSLRSIAFSPSQCESLLNHVSTQSYSYKHLHMDSKPILGSRFHSKTPHRSFDWLRVTCMQHPTYLEG